MEVIELIDASILGSEVTVEKFFQSGTDVGEEIKISDSVTRSMVDVDLALDVLQKGTTVDASILGSEVTQDAWAGMEVIEHIDASILGSKVDAFSEESDSVNGDNG